MLHFMNHTITLFVFLLHFVLTNAKY